MANSKAKQKSTGPTKAQRRAQSQRDKQRNQQRSIPLNSNRIRDTSTSILPIMRMKPSTAFSNGNRRYPGSLRMTGKERLGSLTGGNGVLGQTLMNQQITPSLFNGTRLQTFATMFDKYLFRRLNFVFVTAGGMDPGSLILAYDRDPADNLSTIVATRLRQLTAMLDSEEVPRQAMFSLKTTLSSPEDGFFTGTNAETDPANVRENIQGIFYVINSSGFTGSAGTIWIDYDIDFFIPAIEEDMSSPAPVVEDYKLFAYNGPEVFQETYDYNNEGFFYKFSNFTSSAWDIVQTGFENIEFIPNSVSYPPAYGIKIPQGTQTAMEIDVQHQYNSPGGYPSPDATASLFGSVLRPLDIIIRNTLGVDVTNDLIQAGHVLFDSLDSGFLNDCVAYYRFNLGNVWPPNNWQSLKYLIKAPYDLYLDVISFSKPSSEYGDGYKIKNDDYVQGQKSGLTIEFEPIADPSAFDVKRRLKSYYSPEKWIRERETLMSNVSPAKTAGMRRALGKEESRSIKIGTPTIERKSSNY